MSTTWHELLKREGGMVRRVSIAAKRGNEKIFERWKAGSPMNAFLTRRPVQSYKVPDETLLESFDEEQSES